MTEIHQSPSRLPSSPSSTGNDVLHQQTYLGNNPLFNSSPSYSVALYRGDTEEEEEGERKQDKEKESDQLSLLTLLVDALRKSLVGCRSTGRVELEELSSSSSSMEIGVPTNVRHVAHVTFDRFNGFLGLPVEFEPEVPRRPPSASTSVFGVSTESMQLSFDPRGNSVPTILLIMQRRLYMQGGLEAEGIFRINGENSQGEYVREQLNSGVVPDNIDVHCLAGLIKAWFRELPNGLLDSLPPEEVMQAQSEEECTRLLRRLPLTEAALLDWAINLMADVAQLENLNKMNARNIAMVFAPNMTQMADPLTALVHAVQVMNFLKTLIVRTLKEREDSMAELASPSQTEPSNGNRRPGTPQPSTQVVVEVEEHDPVFLARQPSFGSHPHHIDHDLKSENEGHGFLTSVENFMKGNSVDTLDEGGSSSSNTPKKKMGQPSNLNLKRGCKKVNEWQVAEVVSPLEKSRGMSIVSRLNSRTERVEAWR
ncbi:hypothetical protein NMG60_11008488 [Bertholletia excelsa]